MTEKYLLFSLDDEKSKKLGEVISNSTCKKIVNLLAEKELSESDIAKELGMPINTAEYNIKKLVEAGIIEKAKHWWSVKGKKINIYRVANKLIVISPKKSNVYSKLKGIVPIVLISGILTAFLAWFYKPANIQIAERAFDAGKAMPQAATGSEAVSGAVNIVSSVPNVWIWFLIGSLIAILAFVIWHWKKL